MGVPTALATINALTLAFVAFYGLNLAMRPQPLPRSVVILSWILSIGAILGIRLLWKSLRRSPRRNSGDGRRILIIGAGDAGAMVARELARSPTYPGHPVGFVDDDPRKQRARIENLEVLGTTFDLPRLLTEKQIGEVILSAPSAPTRLIRQVVRVCLDMGVTCRTVPALADYIEGKGALDQVREVQIEDLLGRDPIAARPPGNLEPGSPERRCWSPARAVRSDPSSVGSSLASRPGRLVAARSQRERLDLSGSRTSRGLSAARRPAGSGGHQGRDRDPRALRDAEAASRFSRSGAQARQSAGGTPARGDPQQRHGHA